MKLHVNTFSPYREADRTYIDVQDATVARWREELTELFGSTEAYYHLTKKGMVQMNSWMFVDDYPVWKRIDATVSRKTKQATDGRVAPLLFTWLKGVLSKEDLEQAKVLFKKTFADEIGKRRERSRKVREFEKSLKDK